MSMPIVNQSRIWYCDSVERETYVRTNATLLKSTAFPIQRAVK